MKPNWIAAQLHALDLMDAWGWCECFPPQDACDLCKARRVQIRNGLEQKQGKVTVFKGEERAARKLDW